MPAMKLRATLRSDDTPDQRADNIMTLLGLTGDPRILAEQRAVIADALRQYREMEGRR